MPSNARQFQESNENKSNDTRDGKGEEITPNNVPQKLSFDDEDNNGDHSKNGKESTSETIEANNEHNGHSKSDHSKNDKESNGKENNISKESTGKENNTNDQSKNDEENTAKKITSECNKATKWQTRSSDKSDSETFVSTLRFPFLQIAPTH